MPLNKHSKVSKTYPRQSNLAAREWLVLALAAATVVISGIFVIFVASADKGSGLGRISQGDLAKISQIGKGSIVSANKSINIPNPPSNNASNAIAQAKTKPPQNLPTQLAKPTASQPSVGPSKVVNTKADVQNNNSTITLGTNSANLFQNLGSQSIDNTIDQYSKTNKVNVVSGIVSINLPQQPTSNLLAAYYLDKKLAYYTDKPPYTFVLDTLNMPNKVYRLDAVAMDQQNNVISHYVYLFQTENNPSTWQKFVNYITTPFRAIFG